MPNAAPGTRNTVMNKTNESSTSFELIFSSVSLLCPFRLQESTCNFQPLFFSVTTMPTRLEQEFMKVCAG